MTKSSEKPLKPKPFEIPNDVDEYFDWMEIRAAKQYDGDVEDVDPFHDGKLDKIYTHAEMIVLTACLVSPSLARRVLTHVTDADFIPDRRGSHRRMAFRLMRKLYEVDKAINIPNITQAVPPDKHKLVDWVISRLDVAAYDKANPDIDYYIRVVTERIRKKKLYELSVDMAAMSKNGLSTSQIMHEVESRLEHLKAEYGEVGAADTDEMVSEHDDIAGKIASGEIVPITLPYRGLEEVRLLPGNQCVIGAHTSVGKSAFALNIALMLAREGHRVLWATTEMSRVEMIQRIASCLVGIGVGLIRKENLMLKDYPALMQWERDKKKSGGRFKVFFDADCTEAKIADELDSGKNYDVIFIDYIQDLDSVKKFYSEREKITYLSKWLRVQAAERGIVLFVMSQLARPQKDKNGAIRKPTEWELKESGSIENKTEVVVLLHRLDRDASLREWIINVEVCKNRNGGKCEVQYLFDSWKGRWYACDMDAVDMPDVEKPEQTNLDIDIEDIDDDEPEILI